eukprot:Hpha_TRINITY_DN16523_c5_g2::TRINITY_DN16523_c5_g2_i1::g.137019::m.137019
MPTLSDVRRDPSFPPARRAAATALRTDSGTPSVVIARSTAPGASGAVRRRRGLGIAEDCVLSLSLSCRRLSGTGTGSLRILSLQMSVRTRRLITSGHSVIPPQLRISCIPFRRAARASNCTSAINRSFVRLRVPPSLSSLRLSDDSRSTPFHISTPCSMNSLRRCTAPRMQRVIVRVARCRRRNFRSRIRHRAVLPITLLCSNRLTVFVASLTSPLSFCISANSRLCRRPCLSVTPPGDPYGSPCTRPSPSPDQGSGSGRKASKESPVGLAVGVIMGPDCRAKVHTELFTRFTTPSPIFARLVCFPRVLLSCLENNKVQKL